jgi:hypothetical protein
LTPSIVTKDVRLRAKVTNLKVLEATGLTDPDHFQWSIVRGSLPARLNMSPSGWITGIPLAPGVSEIDVELTDLHVLSRPSTTATLTLRIT